MTPSLSPIIRARESRYVVSRSSRYSRGGLLIPFSYEVDRLEAPSQVSNFSSFMPDLWLNLDLT